MTLLHLGYRPVKLGDNLPYRLAHRQHGTHRGTADGANVALPEHRAQRLDAVAHALKCHVAVVPRTLQIGETLTAQLLQGREGTVEFAEQHLFVFALFEQPLPLLRKTCHIFDIAADLVQVHEA